MLLRKTLLSTVVCLICVLLLTQSIEQCFVPMCCAAKHHTAICSFPAPAVGLQRESKAKRKVKTCGLRKNSSIGQKRKGK